MKKPFSEDLKELAAQLEKAGVKAEAVVELMALANEFIDKLRAKLEGVAFKALPVILPWLKKVLQERFGFIAKMILSLGGWKMLEAKIKELLSDISPEKVG